MTLSLQFNPGEDSTPKLRRMVDEINRLYRDISALSKELDELQAAASTPVEVQKHDLLGVKHALPPGLVAGQVLKALSADAVAFSKLSFGEMSQTDAGTFGSVQNGYVLTFFDGYYSMKPNAAEIADTQIAAGYGIEVMFTGLEYTISLDTDVLWTEVEHDFGAVSRSDFRFTIADPRIHLTSRVAVMPSGKPAIGRGSDDWQWDSAAFAAQCFEGYAEIFALFTPGPIIGRRTLQYQVT